MWRWIAKAYSRRIVNINVNIVVASLMAITLTAIPLHLSRYFGVSNDREKTILIITVASDWILDLVIAVGLHWLANHWPRTWKRSGDLVHKAEAVMEAAPPPLPFIKDATIIQLQRLCLSPLFYVIGLGVQWLLLQRGYAREFAAILGFLLAVIITRTIHTFWMLRNEKRAIAEWEAARADRKSANLPVVDLQKLSGLIHQKSGPAAESLAVKPPTAAASPKE